MTSLDHLINPAGIAYVRELIPAGTVVPLDPCRDSWLPSVLGLLHGEVAAGRPAVYVQCGVYGLTDRTKDARKLIDSPLFRALIDEDEFVVVPSFDPDSGNLEPGRAQDASFWCGVPTLQTIARQITAHEDQFGPAMVILDRVEDARPYRTLTGEDSDVPALRDIDMTAAQARVWMANDLADWAASRPHASTIASSDAAAVLSALDAKATTRMFGGSDQWFDDDAQKYHAQSLCIQTRQDNASPWANTIGFRVGAPE
jgi:hypothetical protein